METYQIEIIEPRAKNLLDDLANMNLIKLRPLGTKKLFTGLLEKLRSKEQTVPSPDEITAEVEQVRAERYARKSDDQSNTRHKPVD